MKKLIVFFILATGITTLYLSACAGGAQGVKNSQNSYIIDTYVGEVAVSHDGGQKWIPAESGMTLSENDMIKTGHDSFVDIVMPGRGIFRVSFDTVISLKTLSAGVEKIKIKKGKLFVNITKKLKKGESFKVETEVAVVAARGTQFAVEIDGKTTKASVNEGKIVAVENVKLDVKNPETQKIIEQQLEVPISKNESLSINEAQKDKMEKELNTMIKKEGEDHADEIAKKVRKENKREIKPANMKDLNKEFKQLSKEDKIKLIKMKIQELKKRKAEEKKDKEMLEKAMEKGRGGKSMAEKYVGEKQTTIEEDQKAKIADKLLEKTKKKRKIGGPNTSKMFDTNKSDESYLNNLMNKGKKQGGLKKNNPSSKPKSASDLINKYKRKKK